MIRTTTGHPVRALRGAALLLAVWVAYRVPTMRAAFEAAMAATEPARTVPPRAAAPLRIAAASTPRATVGPIVKARSRQRPPRPATHGTALAIALAKPSTIAEPGATTMLPPPLPPTPATPADGSRAAAAPADPNAATAGDVAAQAYARLAVGDRRAALRLFDAALTESADPRAVAWRAQRATLTRRWTGTAYSTLRARGSADLAATPVLGGGQSGAALAWTPDPLASRPFALTARATTAHGDRGQGAFAAVGVAWHPVAGVTLAAERLIAVGPAAHGDWTARIAGGVAQSHGIAEASAYGEAGVVGSATYAAGQAHLGASLHRGRIAVGPGVGVWGSVQRGGGTTVDRLDLGPGITGRAGAIRLSADYRFRVAGNAAPGSGPVVTLTASF
jgi:hypothetical protein